MQDSYITPYLRQKLGIMILVGVLIAALSFLFLVMSQKNFRVSTDFLVVQNQTTGQDYYSLSKSAEYIGRILGESVHSEAFINEVVKTEKVNSEFLPFDKKKKLDEWSRRVQIKRSQQLAILSIDVLANDQREAVNISDAVAEVLTQKNNLFRGGDQNIEVRILSGPIVEKNPSLSNLAAVIIGGLLVGILISFVWFYFRFQGKEIEEMISRNINEQNTEPKDLEKVNSPVEEKKYSDNIYFTEPSEDEYQDSLRYLNRR